MRENCPDPYTPPASKGSRSGGVSSRQRRHEPFEKGVRKPSWDQGQAGAAFVWQETNRVTSSPPGLGPASSCTPHPPLQDRGLGAAAAPGWPAFVSGAFRRGRLARGVPCPLEGAGRGHGRGTLGGEGEKGLLFAQEGSRHWGPCPRAAGELLARWRAAGGWGRRGGEEGFQAQPSASSSQPPPSSRACPRPTEGQLPLPPRYRTSKGSPRAEAPALQKPPGFGPSTLGRLLSGSGSPGLCLHACAQRCRTLCDPHGL